MKKTVFYITLLLTFFSCNNEKEDTKSKSDKNETKKREQISKKNLESNQILYGKIEGMMCEMGCGGSIRTNLKEKCGVNKVEFDFEKDAKSQICRIYYNSEKTDKNQIYNLVGSIKEGQFKMEIDSVLNMNL